MTLHEYVILRKAELEHFLKHNETKQKELGEDWLPADGLEEGEWFEQELAWLDMKREEETQN